MVEKISTLGAPKAIGPYSQAIRAGDFLFVSGQLPMNPKTESIPDTIEEQTQQSLLNLKAIIEEAGGSISNVVKTVVYLSDIADFGRANEVYSTFFADPYPARAAYQVGCLPKNAKIEIEAIVFFDN